MKKFFSLVAVALTAMAATAQNAPDFDEWDVVDLTSDMFLNWTAADATGVPSGEQCWGACALNESTGLVYGDGNVFYLNYADLSEYQALVAIATEGEPRFLFNRTEDQGYVGVEYPRDFETLPYEVVEDVEEGAKGYHINLAAIVEAQGFAHLHAIKGANWANTTVIYLAVANKKDVTGIGTLVNAVEAGKCFNILGQSVSKLEPGQIYIVNGKKFVNK